MRAIWTRLAPGIATLALALASGAANADDCNVSDFVTGGGFIVFTNGNHGNFGVAGGCKNATFFGHLEYVDHGSELVSSLPTPFTVHGTSITGYVRVGADGTDSQGHPTGIRLICGTARTNLPPFDVDFIVRARDAGEPGDMDEFDITLITTIPPYSTVASLGLSGGNIQLHTSSPSTTGDSSGRCPGA